VRTSFSFSSFDDCAHIFSLLFYLKSVVNKEWPDIRFGPMPEWKIWVGIFLLSGGVNLVLYLWSHFTQSRGDHSGVNDMVEPSIGRALSWKEHLKILLLALVNSACEEVTSRFFWMAEFNKYLPASNIGNVCQSVVFGAWHYHGIPSGWTGVAMTFVYGLIMGFFFQYGDGLLLPVMAHALADYYIFASIVRQQDIASASKER
jgi:membrane protease YdiL (CAAX protease family)